MKEFENVVHAWNIPIDILLNTMVLWSCFPWVTDNSSATIDILTAFLIKGLPSI